MSRLKGIEATMRNMANNSNISSSLIGYKLKRFFAMEQTIV